MTKTNFIDKYPVFSLHVKKDEINFKSTDEIIAYFQERIEKHPVATFIAIFDHYAHTSSLPDATIAPEIKDAKNIVFCFGKQLPNAKMLAVRPRSIGVCELDESFEISFLEVPNAQLQEVVKEWVAAIKTKA